MDMPSGCTKIQCFYFDLNSNVMVYQTWFSKVFYKLTLEKIAIKTFGQLLLNRQFLANPNMGLLPAAFILPTIFLMI